METEMFEHPCIIEGCANVVHFDDEPWCPKHSPDDGSHLPGYSARKAFNMKMDEIKNSETEKKRKNIFDQESD